MKRRARTVPEEMKGTLNLLRMKARRGDSYALEELIRLLVPRIPYKKLYDRTGKNNRDDIRALQAYAVTRAVDRFDPHRSSMEFESFAIQSMRQYVLHTIQWRRRDVPILVYPDAVEFESLMGSHVPFEDEAFDPRLYLIKRQFEQALMWSKPIMLEVYKLCCERPWLTPAELAEMLDCTPHYVRMIQKRMAQLLSEVRMSIIHTVKEFGLEIGI